MRIIPIAKSVLKRMVEARWGCCVGKMSAELISSVFCAAFDLEDGLGGGLIDAKEGACRRHQNNTE